MLQEVRQRQRHAAKLVLTSRDLVHLVLDEEVDQWHESAKEGACQDLAVLDSFGIGWAEG